MKPASNIEVLDEMTDLYIEQMRELGEAPTSTLFSTPGRCLASGAFIYGCALVRQPSMFGIPEFAFASIEAGEPRLYPMLQPMFVEDIDGQQLHGAWALLLHICLSQEDTTSRKIMLLPTMMMHAFESISLPKWQSEEHVLFDSIMRLRNSANPKAEMEHLRQYQPYINFAGMKEKLANANQ